MGVSPPMFPFKRAVKQWGLTPMFHFLSACTNFETMGSDPDVSFFSRLALIFDKLGCA